MAYGTAAKELLKADKPAGAAKTLTASMDRGDNFALVKNGQRLGHGSRSDMRDMQKTIPGALVVPLTPEIHKLPFVGKK